DPAVCAKFKALVHHQGSVINNLRASDDEVLRLKGSQRAMVCLSPMSRYARAAELRRVITERFMGTRIGFAELVFFVLIIGGVSVHAAGGRAGDDNEQKIDAEIAPVRFTILSA